MTQSPSLQQRLQHVPELPGVYLYRNQAKEILYIGKAKCLKKRVRSYFQKSANHNMRIALMVSLIDSIETIITNSESEALLLEAQLIRKHLPRYNVALKDDKSYPYFKLSSGEMFPRLQLVREKPIRGSQYFGPYPSVRDAQHVMHLINKHFLLRTSKMELDGTKTYRPCLNFQLKRCLGPCRGEVSPKDYAEVVKQVTLFLEGKHQELMHLLDYKMTEASRKLEFERAAKIRDQIRATQRIFQKSLVIGPDLHEKDVFALTRESDMAGVQALFIRHGRLLATDFFFFENTEDASDENLLGQVLNRIYMSETCIIPKEILLPYEYSEQEALKTFLQNKSTHAVAIHTPQRGKKKELVEMALKNARINLKEKKHQQTNHEQVLLQVQKKLHLKRKPYWAEAFDISNISGTNPVASMVCWKNNEPHKAGYRKFKIKTVQGPNDFASMEEVLTRCYQRRLDEKKSLPDLVIIDGGKGQLNIAVKVFERLGISLKEVDLIGLAKGRSEKRRGTQRPNEEDYEYVIKPNQKNEIRLNRNSPVLYYLQRIRDESHRFAIEFHRSLRNRQTLRSPLDDIDGIGYKRKMLLLRHFGSVKKIKEASLEELNQVPGIPEILAEKLHQYFH